MAFICITPCWHNGTRYKRGDTLKGGEPPKDAEGNIRHFVEDGAVDPKKGLPDDIKPAKKGKTVAPPETPPAEAPKE